MNTEIGTTFKDPPYVIAEAARADIRELGLPDVLVTDAIDDWFLTSSLRGEIPGRSRIVVDDFEIFVIRDTPTVAEAKWLAQERREAEEVGQPPPKLQRWVVIGVRRRSAADLPPAAFAALEWRNPLTPHDLQVRAFPVRVWTGDVRRIEEVVRAIESLLEEHELLLVRDPRER